VAAVAVGCVAISGCKEEERAAAVPVDRYIKPDSPPTYIPQRGLADAPTLRFTDVTTAAGINFVHVNGAFGKKWMPETIGAGAAFFDCDGDGDSDLLLVNSAYWPGHEGDASSRPTPRLYRNRGDGTFEDATAAAGLGDFSVYGMGVAATDYDGDGDRDVYITAVGANHLLRNDDGRFVDVAEAAGVAFSADHPDGDPWEWSLGATWFDYDRDGDLDLFVCNYVEWTPETDIWATRDGRTKAYATPEKYPGASNTLFRNNGDGTFADVSRPAGVYNPEGKSMSALADDFNDDGWPDLIVTNDTQPNLLYINRQDGTFTNEALSAGVAYDEAGLTRAGMGVDVADLDNDGRRCIAIGNFSGEPVSLYAQQTSDSFLDRAGATRLSKATDVSLTFGLAFADFNLDGFDDLILANGHIEPEIERVRQDWHFRQKPQLFVNNGRGQFVELTDQAGDAFAEPLVGRGVALADIDGDGDLDALLTNNGGAPRLMRNERLGWHAHAERGHADAPSGHADATAAASSAPVVRIRLIGPDLNRDALGACLKAEVAGATLTRFLRTGGSYLSQSEPVATFGLGDAPRIDRLRIRWPDGSEEQYDNLAAGSFYTVQQGQGPVTALPFASARSVTP